jgi:hypothetical protein
MGGGQKTLTFDAQISRSKYSNKSRSSALPQNVGAPTFSIFPHIFGSFSPDLQNEIDRSSAQGVLA